MEEWWEATKTLKGAFAAHQQEERLTVVPTDEPIEGAEGALEDEEDDEDEWLGISDGDTEAGVEMEVSLFCWTLDMCIVLTRLTTQVF